MRTFLEAVIIVLLTCALSAQEKTTEVKTSTNKDTGEITSTESVIVSSTEDITPRNHMLIVNPPKFLLFYNITYYQKVSENITIGGGIQTPTINGLDGFGINAEMRYYPTGKNMRGFYLAPNIAFNTITSGDCKTEPFSFGALVGWQWFPSDQFALGFGIGSDYYTGSSTHNDDDDFDSYSGWVPALRFDIGFAW